MYVVEMRREPWTCMRAVDGWIDDVVLNRNRSATGPSWLSYESLAEQFRSSKVDDAATQFYQLAADWAVGVVERGSYRVIGLPLQPQTSSDVVCLHRTPKLAGFRARVRCHVICCQHIALSVDWIWLAAYLTLQERDRDDYMTLLTATDKKPS